MAAPLYSIISASPAVDLKANGEVSRMRSHKGNIPSLPQTKHCPLCPAKFTRTTHLNRHLRSHTNERLHRCNTCRAEFTRSDLLTRHKRTCGDSNANRSRRKSCQACAESKVKCNLQFPCSKCTSRGRECVFINDPEVSRNKRNASKKSSSLSSRSSAEKDDAGTSSSPNYPSSSPSASTEYSPLSISIDQTALVQPLSASQMAFTTAYDIPILASSGSSTASSQSSPRTEIFDSLPDMSVPFDMSFDALAFDTPMDRILSDNVFQPFLDTQMAACSPQVPDPIDFSWIEGIEMFPTYDDESFIFSQAGYDDQGFSSGYAAVSSPDSISPRMSAPLVELGSTLDMFYHEESASATIVSPLEISAVELDQYLYLFFTAFCTQVPLVHSPTWKMEDKPQMLVRAMQACGALFAKNERANAFISETLASTRETLIHEFAKVTSTPREQAHLILTAVLLQTIGLFYQKTEERVSSNVYHGMLVMMIRRSGIIGRIGAWVTPDLSTPAAVDAAWTEWACYETIKRALFLSYLHDCFHCMYHSLAPSFQPSELDINLPCDNTLWTASSTKDWLEIAQGSSSYGTGHIRLSGIRMRDALASLRQTRLQTAPLSLNMFAQFILIHTILRDMYSPQDQASLTSTLSERPHPKADIASGGASATEDVITTQYALHNWVRMWMNSPESMQAEKSQEEPPFMCNALPFYWLAQVSLMAIQDGKSNFGGTDAKAEGRFRLMKEWLDDIKTVLRGGNQVPTHFWDQIMKIRGQMSQSEGLTGSLQPEGLLTFFSS